MHSLRKMLIVKCSRLLLGPLGLVECSLGLAAVARARGAGR